MTDLTPFNDDYDKNESGNSEFRDLLQKEINRRDLIKRTASGAVALTLAGAVSGCNDDSSETPAPLTPESKLTFSPVDKHTEEKFTVPEGYEACVLYAVGDDLRESSIPWNREPGTELTSGADFNMRAGDCHDGMTYFGMTNGLYDANNSEQGLLVLNHEYIADEKLLNPNYDSLNTRTEDEVLREIYSHGVSIIEVSKDNQNQVSLVKSNSQKLNRRITAATPIPFSGYVCKSDFLKTTFSPNGTFALGTINNCGNGYTPWGTYLTAEENFNQYFSRPEDSTFTTDDPDLALFKRYGIPEQSDLKWHTVETLNENHLLDYFSDAEKLTMKYADENAGFTENPGMNAALEDTEMFKRWNASEPGYQNAPNTFGWIVEIDPFNKQNMAKRTSLGRFAHEDCRVSRAIEGQPLAFYMGDDSRGEYIYKFVSKELWRSSDAQAGFEAGARYMDEGILYVAKFNFDEQTQRATGEWIPLTLDNPKLQGKFETLGELLVKTRIAADLVGATKMDRPEWVAVNPHNGEVYVTLTNNTDRGNKYPNDAANPRQYIDRKLNGGAKFGNINGHIIRFRETGDTTNALIFEWDIFLFGAEDDAHKSVNLSELTANNDFSSPDGMWFDPRGVLWIQTDDGDYTDETNCMMLAALPGSVGDGKVKLTAAGDHLQNTPTGTTLDDTKLRRFLVGPKGCEITGVTMTPDFKAIFVNVQHPGGVWPKNHTPNLSTNKDLEVARSATVVIRRLDGGEIAGEGLISKPSALMS